MEGRHRRTVGLCDCECGQRCAARLFQAVSCLHRQPDSCGSWSCAAGRLSADHDAARSSGTDGRAKITRAYHLPSRYVLHTVGPIVNLDASVVPDSQCTELRSSYLSCLDLAAQVPDIRSIALCCISTGAFSFSKVPNAADIALSAVDDWLDRIRLGSIGLCSTCSRKPTTYCIATSSHSVHVRNQLRVIDDRHRGNRSSVRCPILNKQRRSDWGRRRSFGGCRSRFFRREVVCAGLP